MRARVEVIFAAASLAWVFVGCGEREATPPPSPESRTGAASGVSPASEANKEKGAGSVTPTPPTAPPSAAAPQASSAPPTKAEAPTQPIPVGEDTIPPEPPLTLASARCAVLDTNPDIVLSDKPALASLAVTDIGIFAAAYVQAADGETLRVWRTRRGGEVIELGSLPLTAAPEGARVAPPAVANDHGDPLVAWVDARGELRAARFSDERPDHVARSGVLAQRVDRRTQPALIVRPGFRALAYTDVSATPMRVRYLVLDDALRAREARDLTLESMGAAAPTVVSGHPGDGAELYFIDPRSGISPVLRSTITPGGVVASALVAVPVGIAPSPPDLAVVRVGDEVFLGYTVVGTGATSAVGLVRVSAADRTPTAIVPGRGFGQLAVAGVASRRSAVFAASSPLEGGQEIHVRAAIRDGMGAPLVVRGPSGHASHPALARTADDVIVLALSDEAGLRLRFLRCP